MPLHPHPRWINARFATELDAIRNAICISFCTLNVQEIRNFLESTKEGEVLKLYPVHSKSRKWQNYKPAFHKPSYYW